MAQMACKCAWLFLFLGLGTAVAAKQLAAQRAYSQLSIKVTDAAGSVIPYARIKIFDVKGPINQKDTDASGQAVFVIPRGAQCKATIAASGFMTYAETFRLESVVAKTVTLSIAGTGPGVIVDSPEELILEHQPLMAVIPQQPLELLPPPARPIRHNHRRWL